MEFTVAFGKMEKLCSEKKLRYIFESSPLKLFSRFESERSDVDDFFSQKVRL